MNILVIALNFKVIRDTEKELQKLEPNNLTGYAITIKQKGWLVPINLFVAALNFMYALSIFGGGVL